MTFLNTALNGHPFLKSYKPANNFNILRKKA